MPHLNLAVNNYSDYDKIKQSLDNFNDNFTKVKLGANGLESDNRVKHYLPVGKFKTENQNIEQSTKDLALKLKNALVDKFGQQSGLKLFNKYIDKENIEGKKRFTALDLKILFARAKLLENNLCKTMLKANSLQDYESKTATVLKSCQVKPKMFSHIMVRVATSLNIHSHDYQDLLIKSEDLKNSTKEILNLKAKIEGSKVPDNLQNQKAELLKTLEEHLDTLLEKQRDIDTEVLNYPFKKYKVMAAADEIFAACKTVLSRLAKEKFPNNAGVRENLKNCARTLADFKKDLRAKYANQDVLDPKDAKFLKTFSKDFAKLLADSTGLDAKKLAKEIKHDHIKILEQKEWKTVSNDFTVKCGGKQVQVNSEITPAAKLPFIKAEMKADNLKGITCHDQGRNSHAVNLWKTEFKAGDKVLYSGIRHSINCAYDIKDKEIRAQANANRAKEVFKAVLANNPKLLGEALEGKTVKLDIVSVALMTPDLARKVLPFGFNSKEREHLAEQTNAWKDACNEKGICTMQITDDNGKTHDISIKPNVVAFNYGVNQGAQMKGLQTILHSWDASDEMNKQALRTLIGDPQSPEIHGMVGQFLAQCQDQELKDKITILVDQIKSLHNSGAYREAGEDSFRLPARINLLAHLCGFNPCFNCKSGKDRTGQMDVSTKELALTLEMKKQVSLQTEKDVERKRLMRDIALHSGNLEVQQYNTGMAGFRLKGLECLEKIYGQYSMTHFVGLSENC
ncbi:MAG: hypothetical protein IJU40_08820 [Desulfovibrionaceae bacterium]|nr:hypothetical protein [Desulfovibrionaceae bacterium]